MQNFLDHQIFPIIAFQPMSPFFYLNLENKTFMFQSMFHAMIGSDLNVKFIFIVFAHYFLVFEVANLVSSFVDLTSTKNPVLAKNFDVQLDEIIQLIGNVF